MDKALFGIVDRAIGEALLNRPSKLDQIELEGWNDELLKEDARDVSRVIDEVAALYGWTGEAYNRVYRKLRDNRHYSY